MATLTRDQALKSKAQGTKAVNELFLHAFWAKWQLSLHAFAVGINAKAEDQAEHEELFQVVKVLSKESGLLAELDRVQRQLGKYVAMAERMEFKLRESITLRTQLEGETRQLKKAHNTVVNEMKALKDSSASVQKMLEARLEEAQAAHSAVEGELTATREAKKRLETHLAEYVAAKNVLESNKAELERSLASKVQDVHDREAALIELRGRSEQAYTTLRVKYLAAKTKLADAGEQVTAVSAEKAQLKMECSLLQNQLADVENFLASDSGAMLKKMEAEVAEAKLALAQVEADRDELEVQLSSQRR